MQNLVNYKGFILNEQSDVIKKASIKETMDAYKNDTQARSNINAAIQSNASYNSIFTAIKNYWTKQITLLKNKPQDQLTDEESNLMDTIKSNFGTGDPKAIEEYAMNKVLSGHSADLVYQKDLKKMGIMGYTETVYDKSIKSK
jgi:predicted transcriptional regulator